MMDYTTDLRECLKTLSDGGIIIYPTDTLWGLGCDATNEEAVKKLIALKGKTGNNGLIVLLTSEREVLQYVTQADLAVFNYLQSVNKPTTVIYEGGTGVANEVLSADGSIAIRLVKDDFCRHLVKRFRKPLVSTSANLHGEPSPAFFKDINIKLIRSADYVVLYRREDTQASMASSIIKWKKSGYPEILR